MRIEDWKITEMPSKQPFFWVIDGHRNNPTSRYVVFFVSLSLYLAGGTSWLGSKIDGGNFDLTAWDIPKLIPCELTMALSSIPNKN